MDIIVTKHGTRSLKILRCVVHLVVYIVFDGNYKNSYGTTERVLSFKNADYCVRSCVGVHRFLSALWSCVYKHLKRIVLSKSWIWNRILLSI